jgi:WD40 repeat protein
MDTSEVSLADAERVTLRCEAVLEGHGADEVGVARVWHCAWDPAGKTLATCSSDKTCRIWAKSAAAGNSWVTVAELEGVHSRTVRQAAWSPCGASPHGRHDDGCNKF